MDETLVPFLSGFANAATSMKNLKEAVIWTALRWNPYDAYGIYEEGDFDAKEEIGKYTQGRLAWGIAYVKPGELALDTHPGVNFCDSRQIWWKVGKWRPDAEFHDRFQQIGRNHEENLIEYWHGEEYGDELVESQIFEEF